MKDIIKVTLPNGLVIEGTPTVVLEAVAKQGFEPGHAAPKGYYLSSSKGLLKISEMNSYHIRNAICLIYRGWAAKLNDMEIEPFVKVMRDGPTDPQLQALYEELVRRVKEGL